MQPARLLPRAPASAPRRHGRERRGPAAVGLGAPSADAGEARPRAPKGRTGAAPSHNGATHSSSHAPARPGPPAIGGRMMGAGACPAEPWGQRAATRQSVPSEGPRQGQSSAAQPPGPLLSSRPAASPLPSMCQQAVAVSLPLVALTGAPPGHRPGRRARCGSWRTSPMGPARVARVRADPKGGL